jgi:hypothetical protein
MSEITMPFLIHPRNYATGEIHWEDVWPIERQGDAYVNLGSQHGQTPALEGPIPYRMYKGRLGKSGSLPDIVPGRWDTDLIVSARVRALIREMDAFSHHFIPLELTLRDGTTVSSHFLFVAGDLVDGIVAEESEVLPKIFGGKLAYYSVGGDPKIVWRADAISGRAIWVDKYLRNQVVISDELQVAFERNDIQKYKLTASAVASSKSGI